jgi:hypothetical protein
MTKSDFWEIFDANQADVRRLVAKYHPTAATSGRQRGTVITARAAESACEEIRKDIREASVQMGITRFDTAAKERDAVALIRILNEAWFGMPESTSVRNEPGFFALCDLCEGLDDYDEATDEA